MKNFRIIFCVIFIALSIILCCMVIKKDVSSDEIDICSDEISYSGRSVKNSSGIIEPDYSYDDPTHAVPTKLYEGPCNYIEDFDLICNVVMNEAGAEPREGMCAVAQCIMNACEREKKPFSEIRNKYGYYYSKRASDEVKDAVWSVLFDNYRVTSEPIIVFYNPSLVTSNWHESQTYVMTIGSHRFFKFN